MSTKLSPGEFDIIAAALPDEPLFTLAARDPSAPAIIRAWARQRRDDIFTANAGPVPDEAKEDLRKATAAEVIADDMTIWRRDNLGRWRGGDERRRERPEPQPAEIEDFQHGAIRALAIALAIPSMWHHSKLEIARHTYRRWASPHFPHLVHELEIMGEGLDGLRGVIEIDPVEFAIPRLIVADVICTRASTNARMIVHAVHND